MLEGQILRTVLGTWIVRLAIGLMSWKTVYEQHGHT